ncbi:DUF2027 domain-containing protein [Cytophagales bacterium LB-30]|uniref:DUF2027 domain-containing protein n=1 Tax=Shiella aurantiaca TaxID=3058365 RepID=A0ABT8F1P5_9BACT|nr:DUF2027 domain-containing protein [Shiella aurantiaca]MDN4164368.1 DUF2027 domain-containing protein [Shiella aurantiaca]
MNIGDKVRLLHGNEQGFVTRILDAQTVEIEIEEGFRIPVLRRELVIVAKEEGVYFRNEASDSPKENPILSKQVQEEGIFLGFKAYREDELEVYLINQTSFELVFSASEAAGNLHQGLAAGTVQPGKHVRLTERKTSQFESWPNLLLRVIRHPLAPAAALPIIEKNMHFKAANFYKAKRKSAALGGEAYIFKVDDQVAAFDVHKLKESMMEGNEQSVSAPIPVKRPDKTIDLHIEKLQSEPVGKNKALEIQLQHFETTLDQAIASGMDEITFIHGVGNGVLRDAIHKKLSKNPRVAFFKDSQKDKFGYGATLVHIKA